MAATETDDAPTKTDATMNIAADGKNEDMEMNMQQPTMDDGEAEVRMVKTEKELEEEEEKRPDAQDQQHHQQQGDDTTRPSSLDVDDHAGDGDDGFLSPQRRPTSDPCASPDPMSFMSPVYAHIRKNEEASGGDTETGENAGLPPLELTPAAVTAEGGGEEQKQQLDGDETSSDKQPSAAATAQDGTDGSHLRGKSFRAGSIMDPTRRAADQATVDELASQLHVSVHFIEFAPQVKKVKVQRQVGRAAAQAMNQPAIEEEKDGVDGMASMEETNNNNDGTSGGEDVFPSTPMSPPVRGARRSNSWNRSPSLLSSPSLSMRSTGPLPSATASLPLGRTFSLTNDSANDLCVLIVPESTIFQVAIKSKSGASGEGGSHGSTHESSSASSSTSAGSLSGPLPLYVRFGERVEIVLSLVELPAFAPLESCAFTLKLRIKRVTEEQMSRYTPAAFWMATRRRVYGRQSIRIEYRPSEKASDPRTRNREESRRKELVAQATFKDSKLAQEILEQERAIRMVEETQMKQLREMEAMAKEEQIRLEAVEKSRRDAALLQEKLTEWLAMERNNVEQRTMSIQERARRRNALAATANVMTTTTTSSTSPQKGAGRSMRRGKSMAGSMLLPNENDPSPPPSPRALSTASNLVAAPKWTSDFSSVFTGLNSKQPSIPNPPLYGLLALERPHEDPKLFFDDEATRKLQWARAFYRMDEEEEEMAKAAAAALAAAAEEAREQEEENEGEQKEEEQEEQQEEDEEEEEYEPEPEPEPQQVEPPQEEEEPQAAMPEEDQPPQITEEQSEDQPPEDESKTDEEEQQPTSALTVNPDAPEASSTATDEGAHEEGLTQRDRDPGSARSTTGKSIPPLSPHTRLVRTNSGRLVASTSNNDSGHTHRNNARPSKYDLMAEWLDLALGPTKNQRGYPEAFFYLMEQINNYPREEQQQQVSQQNMQGGGQHYGTGPIDGRSSRQSSRHPSASTTLSSLAPLTTFSSPSILYPFLLPDSILFSEGVPRTYFYTGSRNEIRHRSWARISARKALMRFEVATIYKREQEENGDGTGSTATEQEKDSLIVAMALPTPTIEGRSIQSPIYLTYNQVKPLLMAEYGKDKQKEKDPISKEHGSRNSLNEQTSGTLRNLYSSYSAPGLHHHHQQHHQASQSSSSSSPTSSSSNIPFNGNFVLQQFIPSASVAPPTTATSDPASPNKSQQQLHQQQPHHEFFYAQWTWNRGFTLKRRLLSRPVRGAGAAGGGRGQDGSASPSPTRTKAVLVPHAAPSTLDHTILSPSRSSSSTLHSPYPTSPTSPDTQSSGVGSSSAGMRSNVLSEELIGTGPLFRRLQSLTDQVCLAINEFVWPFYARLLKLGVVFVRGVGEEWHILHADVMRYGGMGGAWAQEERQVHGMGGVLGQPVHGKPLSPYAQPVSPYYGIFSPTASTSSLNMSAGSPHHNNAGYPSSSSSWSATTVRNASTSSARSSSRGRSRGRSTPAVAVTVGAVGAGGSGGVPHGSPVPVSSPSATRSSSQSRPTYPPNRKPSSSIGKHHHSHHLLHHPYPLSPYEETKTQQLPPIS